MHEVQAEAARLVAGVLGGRSIDEADFAGPAGRAAPLRDLTLGTLRRLGTHRAVAAGLASRGFTDPRLESLVCVALHQLQHTRAAAHAVVTEAVQAARISGLAQASGFVNAALRRFLRESERCVAQARTTPEGLWNHPAWWVDRVRAAYPDRAEAILSAGTDHPPMTLRVNQRRATVASLLETLAAAGIEARAAGPVAIRLQRPRPTRELPGHAEGLFSVQDAGAQWAAPLLDLAPGMRVLDACAAPGGKACHVLESADVALTALDLDATRLGAIRQPLARLGLEARLLQADAGQPDRWWDGQPFDRVLLDAPCSASGIVRRHPDARWLRRPEDLARFAATQRRLLAALWQVLAPGGKLLYVTCSVFPEENAHVVRDWLSRSSDARLLPLEGFPAPDGVLLPSGEHDGFFYALLHKR